MKYPARRNVLLVGDLPIQDRPFAFRNLNLINVKCQDVSIGANEACGVIIAETAKKIGVIRQHIEELRPISSQYGLSLITVAETDSHLLPLKNLLDELKLGDDRLYSQGGIENAAEFLNHYDPGPPVGDPKIIKEGPKLSLPIKHFLQRAFSDCDRIYIEPLGGGRVAAGVYCVHAWLKRSIIGPRPLPFFIKIDKSDRISKELQNYEYYADFYIPFYLRPNIDKGRCINSEKMSALVGNFVEDSRPLRSVLQSNQGNGTLFSLFEHSLKGFRIQPANKLEKRTQKLFDFVKDRAWIDGLKSPVIKKAQKLGLKSSPKKIEDMLDKILQDDITCITPCHGDLHAGNIMVRGKDAILIDFLNIEDGPISADPATLEVSLVFGTEKDDSKSDWNQWKSFVDEIYKEPFFHRPPAAEKRPNRFSWLRKAIREIRHIPLGCDCTEKEASAVLVAYLLRFARLNNEMAKNKELKELAFNRHAYALVVAERITKYLHKQI